MQRKKLLNWLFPAIRPPAPADSSSLLGEADIFAQLEAKEGSALFLGKFSIQQIQAALQRSSIIDALRARGIADCLICIEPIDEFNQALRIYNTVQQPERLIAEMRLREVVFIPQKLYPDCEMSSEFPMLSIDWLMMQNPDADFTPEHPPLPGQQHPGLGLGRKVLRLLVTYCRWQELAGIINYPEYFHNAYIYRETFSFFMPERSGLLLALIRDLGKLSLAEMSWAIELGCVTHRETASVFEWTSDVQIMPLRTSVQTWFDSEIYRQRELHAMQANHFELDERTFREKADGALRAGKFPQALN